MQYDHRNRLTHFEKRSVGGVILEEVSFTYDALNRRIIKSSSAGTVVTVYNGQVPWADYDENGNVLARYLPDDVTDHLLARQRPGEGTVWYLPDRLGSVRDLAGSDGQTVAHIDYDSFGSTVGTLDTNLVDRFLFTGRELDVETGLYYYRARYYDPASGRFISQDPIGFTAGDANLYTYVGNGPTNFVDPGGLNAGPEYGKTASGPSIWRQALCSALGNVAGVGIGFVYSASGLYAVFAPVAQELTQLVVEGACLSIPKIELPRIGPGRPPGPPRTPSPTPSRIPPPQDRPELENPELLWNLVEAYQEQRNKYSRRVKELDKILENRNRELETLKDAYNRLLEQAKDVIDIFDD